MLHTPRLTHPGPPTALDPWLPALAALILWCTTQLAPWSLAGAVALAGTGLYRLPRERASGRRWAHVMLCLAFVAFAGLFLLANHPWLLTLQVSLPLLLLSAWLRWRPHWLPVAPHPMVPIAAFAWGTLLIEMRPGAVAFLLASVTTLGLMTLLHPTYELGAATPAATWHAARLGWLLPLLVLVWGWALL